VAEACADQHVYLVPLSGGVRIGLCAIPESKVERVAEALAKAAEAVE
jgi:aspartate/tyrosine/aromatic aminotransferase